MIVSSASNILLPFIVILLLNVVQGTLTPNGNVSVDCGSRRTFICKAPGEPIEWTTSGLRGIRRGPFRARIEAFMDPRIMSTDAGADFQSGLSAITISGFSRSDNGGIIQCINAENSNVRGMASISVGIQAPANVVAKAESCDTVTVQWDQPSAIPDITTSVSCTPPSPGCTECTTSPCNITGFNASTEYEFTVTLNSTMCGTSMNTTGIGTRGFRAPANVVAKAESCSTVTLQWDQPSEPNDITTSVSCTPPSPGCAGCTTSPCNITGLTPNTEYAFTVTLNSGGCRTSMNHTVETACKFSCPACISQSCTSSTAPLLTGTIPTVVLLLVSNIISVLGVFFITRHCYKNTSQKNSPSKGEDVYDQVEGPKTYEDIVMTDSPAYGPVK